MGVVVHHAPWFRPRIKTPQLFPNKRCPLIGVFAVLSDFKQIKAHFPIKELKMGENGHSAPNLTVFEAQEREIYDHSRKNNYELLRPRITILVGGHPRSTKNVGNNQGKWGNYCRLIYQQNYEPFIGQWCALFWGAGILLSNSSRRDENRLGKLQK